MSAIPLRLGTCAIVGPWFKSEKDISLSGAWVRNNYAPPTASEPSTGYALLPVRLPWEWLDGAIRGNVESKRVRPK